MPAEQLKPYIGITGPTRRNEATLINRIFTSELTTDSSHQGMVGYLVSHRTLRGQVEGRSRYPAISVVPDMLKITRNPVNLNMVHYLPTSTVPLSEQVSRLFNYQHIYADNLARAIQINQGWPSPDELEKIKSEMADLQVVLALTPSVLSSNEDANSARIEIQSKLKRYDGTISGILIDFSGGKGIPFSSEKAGAISRAIDAQFFKQPVIFGGGFNDTNLLPRLEDLSNRLGTKYWGIDAEGALRTPPNDDKTSLLNLAASSAYLSKAIRFFQTPYEEIVDFTKDIGTN